MKQLQRLAIYTISLLLLAACGAQSSKQEHVPLKQNMYLLAESFSLPALEYSPPNRYETLPKLDLQAESAVLIHAESGDILYEENIDESLPVASMSKIMTELLVLEAIDAGEIAWEDTVPVSEYAYMISNHPGFSTVLLNQKDSYTVKELFTAMAIHSANGATIALAEKISGSEKNFIPLMNDRAQQLGLTNSKFVNSTGLTNHDLGDFSSTGKPTDSNMMSARDAATLALYVIEKHPELLDMAKMKEFDFHGETYGNSNWMLPETEISFIEEDVSFDGVDGLKTGFTKEAGYCFTGSVQINDERFISVVMGTPNLADRFLETGMLYEAASQQVEAQLASQD